MEGQDRRGGAAGHALLPIAAELDAQSRPARGHTAPLILAADPPAAAKTQLQPGVLLDGTAVELVTYPLVLLTELKPAHLRVVNTPDSSASRITGSWTPTLCGNGPPP